MTLNSDIEIRVAALDAATRSVPLMSTVSRTYDDDVRYQEDKILARAARFEKYLRGEATS